MCDIVLGAEIERALRAVQRDEGWNCKGAHSATIAIPGLGEEDVAGLCNLKSSAHSELLMLASECESLKEFRKRLQGIIDRQ